MANGDLQFLYYSLPVFVLCMAYPCVRAYLFTRNSTRHNAYVALLSPSLRGARSAFDRRVALAVREAKLGFVECVACGFTNPKRSAVCVLCGVQVARRRPRWMSAIKKSETELSPQLSKRQRRIRRRKEWTRELVEQGQIVWQHNKSLERDSVQQLFRSYILQTVIATSELEIKVDGAQQLQTIGAANQHLLCELQATRFECVDSSIADAASVLFKNASHTLSISISDSIANSKLDFPTKLAQFITSMASLFNETCQNVEAATGTCAASVLKVRRESIVHDSIEALAVLGAERSRGAIRVNFADEQGIDAGGVYREWFLQLNQMIINPNHGIFTCVDQHDRTFFLNPHSREVIGENHLVQFLAVGRLLGRALLEGNVTGFHLSLPLLKMMLGLPVSFDDLEFFDLDAYKNLKWLVENENVDILGLDFTVTEKLPDGSCRTVELVPGGEAIDVTDANKHDYIEQRLKRMLFDSVSDQLFAFLKGLYEIVPAELLMLFDAEELDYILSGSDEIDVDDWEANSIMSKNLWGHPAGSDFWKVVRELSIDERRRLLQFATGSTRVPPGGFGSLTSNDGRLCLFSLRGVPSDSTRGYIYSHACFNRLDLPMHGWLKDTRAAVHAAIASDSIGFTTD